ncbi:MAG: hypothetical protein H7202_09720 [Pedobacter sp.]|uniref:hypothetical protein n=1 Tax=Pedobacter sp. JCM 36344 TaxID=3374280 RepID=UPI001987188D|nr:hypothetical protein [Pedobacter sp.]
MKELLQQILSVLAEILFQQKLQLIPIKVQGHPDRWIDQRNAMHMLMRTDRQLRRYVSEGQLISKRIGRSLWYLESSILGFMERSEEF